MRKNERTIIIIIPGKKTNRNGRQKIANIYTL